MQVTETLSEGLRRELKVTVPAADLEADVEGKLDELRKTVTMKGFRPGKVPLSIVRRHYQPRVLGEVLQQTIETRSRKVIEERDLRPAMQPEIAVTAYDEGKDLEFTMGMEVLPEIEFGDFSDLAVTRLTAEVSDDAVADALARLAEAERRFEPVDEARPAQDGDQLLVDIAVEVDGKPAPERSGSDVPLELGEDAPMPDLTGPLVGAEAGEERAVTIAMPAPDPDAEEPDPDAEEPTVDTLFRVTVKEVRERIPTTIDDALAERRGAGDLDELRGVVREQLQEHYERASQAGLKRSILDRLDERHRFEVPPGMVEREFGAIWQQVEADAKNAEAEIATILGQPEEEAREEFRQIAERRVRLGLLIAEIGRANDIAVEQDDLMRAALEGARNHPEPKRLLDFYRAEPQMLERFRAPVFEDKVIAFLSELATITDEAVDVDTLMRDPDEDDKAASVSVSAAAGDDESTAEDEPA
jgi:trigger factor